jgi:hypothetical protein
MTERPSALSCTLGRAQSEKRPPPLVYFFGIPSTLVNVPFEPKGDFVDVHGFRELIPVHDLGKPASAFRLLALLVL